MKNRISKLPGFYVPADVKAFSAVVDRYRAEVLWKSLLREGASATLVSSAKLKKADAEERCARLGISDEIWEGFCESFYPEHVLLEIAASFQRRCAKAVEAAKVGKLPDCIKTDIRKCSPLCQHFRPVSRSIGGDV